MVVMSARRPSGAMANWRSDSDSSMNVCVVPDGVRQTKAVDAKGAYRPYPASPVPWWMSTPVRDAEKAPPK
jgi:hypothetical protein